MRIHRIPRRPETRQVARRGIPDPLEDIDIAGLDFLADTRGDVVFGSDVSVYRARGSEDLGDHVVLVGYAVGPARLGGYELGKEVLADVWGAVGVLQTD